MEVNINSYLNRKISKNLILKTLSPDVYPILVLVPVNLVVLDPYLSQHPRQPWHPRNVELQVNQTKTRKYHNLNFQKHIFHE